MMRIIVAEYPKSGASWFCSVLGMALSLPVRDIYVQDGYSAFDVYKHPWYAGSTSLALTESCVIKSHELPDSSLHNFPANTVHMLRDGRDVVVSKYFFEKDFCVDNGIFSEFTMTFDEYVEKTAREWAQYVDRWMQEKAVPCMYELMLHDPLAEVKRVLSSLGFVVAEGTIVDAINANTKDKFRRALDKTFTHNTFVRKGVAGDWRNHFSEVNKKSFKQNAGEVLIRLGYERDMGW